MKLSFSKYEMYKRCPLAFKLKYIDEVGLLPNYEANNPLLVGTALHDLKNYEETYLKSFPKITTEHYNELMKLDEQVPKLIRAIESLSSKNIYYEFKLETDDFIGYIDLLVKNKDGSFDIYDFKYSNNKEYYLKSQQLHLYKYFFEKITNKKVRRLGYFFVGKSFLRQKQNEELYAFRKRVLENLKGVEIEYVKYDEDMVNRVLKENLQIIKYTCCDNDFCDYCKAIKNGEEYMLIPKNERREKKIDLNPDMWIYGDSYVGKSTFVDQFEDLLFINTDGNTDNTTSPVITLKDDVKQDGRITKRKFAWEIFLDIVKTLETEKTDYKTIAIDLVEDLKEHCRLYVFDKYKWEHESDGSFGKGWSMVKNEFLNTMKRLKVIGYQIIYISKEVKEDVQLRGGITRTLFSPNIDDKTINVLTGTVDLTIRAFVNDEGEHKLLLEKQTGVVGGGRFKFKRKDVDLNLEKFKEALIEAQSGQTVKEKQPSIDEEDFELDNIVNPFIDNEEEVVKEEVVKDEPRRRRRREV